MIGSEVDVLLEGPSSETDMLWQARMASQALEILDFLEQATDRCEDVANVLEGVVVKHA